MIVQNPTIEHFVQTIINGNKKMIVFGAGVITQVVMDYLCKEYSLTHLLEEIIDNDRDKWNTKIRIADREMEVNPVTHAASYREDRDIVFVITGSHYYGMLQQLEAMELGEKDCYILPVMYASHPVLAENGVIKMGADKLIPKTIHYIWFGGRKLPDLLKRCIATWEKYCPDYDIIRWDEDNYDIDRHPYMRQAYEHGCWGYVSDYARIDILYRYGGIYMDTDVELVKGLDEMLYQSAFTSVEKWNVINTGGCTGAVVHHPAIKRMLEERKDIPFIMKHDVLNKISSGYYDTKPFLRNGYKLNGMNQTIEGMNIYGFEYFHPYDYMSGETLLTENTFGIHHFHGGWVDAKSKEQRQKSRLHYRQITGSTK